MSVRLIAANGAAAAFLLAGFTAFSEASSGLHAAYLWFGVALAITVIAFALPDDRPAR